MRPAAVKIVRQDFQITILVLGPLQVNTIFLHRVGETEGWLFDGGADALAVQKYLAAAGLTATKLWHTHGHFDHTGTTALFGQTIPAYLAQEDLPLYHQVEQHGALFGMPIKYDPHRSWQDLAANSTFAWAKRQDFMRVLATPGHTPGGRCFYFKDLALLLTGDTLFAGSVGRTDLPGGDFKLLQASLKEQILPLPPSTTIIPGHGPISTLEAEKNNNPYLQDLV